MPVWHEASKQWVKVGRLAIVGVTHEQHAERCRLFAQWHELDWPILHDPINQIEALAVPILVAIDEHGIVRSTRPRIESFERDFLDRTFSNDAPPIDDAAGVPDVEQLTANAQSADTAEAWRELGDVFVLWGGEQRIDAAIDAYRKSVEHAPQDGNALFRLGVCFRQRYESAHRQPGDFQAAVDHWQRALETDPNQYIWRRRIQQYGPRLSKPYPFYDWIRQAKSDILARGETPVVLPVSLTGAEIARPQRDFSASTDKEKSPDADGKTHRDLKNLIEIDVSIVPRRAQPGQPVRAHIAFHPNAAQDAHWNNESDPLLVWIEPPAGWQVSHRLLRAVQPAEPESTETRRLDFEIRAPDDLAADANDEDAAQLKAYALYYVCEGREGACLYLRQDIQIGLDRLRSVFRECSNFKAGFRKERKKGNTNLR